MVSARRIPSELCRQLHRTSSVLPALLLLLGGLLSHTINPEGGANSFLHLTYLVVPLGLLPLAAHRAARDRATRIAEIHATTPAQQGELFLGQLFALEIALLGGLLATVPIYAVALSTMPTFAYLQLAEYFLWAFLVGTASIGAGLTLGSLLPDRPRLSLSSSFLLFLAWIVIAINFQAGGILGAVGNVLVQTNPYEWAQAADGSGVVMEDARPVLVVGVGLLAVAYLAVASLVRLGLQDARGWVERLGDRPVPLGLLLGLLLVSGSALGGWTPLEPADPPTPTICAAQREK